MFERLLCCSCCRRTALARRALGVVHDTGDEMRANEFIFQAGAADDVGALGALLKAASEHEARSSARREAREDASAAASATYCAGEVVGGCGRARLGRV